MGRGPGYNHGYEYEARKDAHDAPWRPRFDADAWLADTLVAAAANSPANTLRSLADWPEHRRKALDARLIDLGVTYYIVKGPTGVWSLTIKGNDHLASAVAALGLAERVAQVKAGIQATKGKTQTERSRA